MRKNENAGGKGAAPAPGMEAKHAVGRQLNYAAKAARTYLEQHLMLAGSSFATWTVLFALKSRSPLIQREIADMLGVEGPTLTRHLARMEAEGLIVRRRTPEDRRAAVVELSPQGQAAYKRLSRIVSAGGEQVLDGFSDGELDLLISFLTRIVENVNKSSPRSASTH